MFPFSNPGLKPKRPVTHAAVNRSGPLHMRRRTKFLQYVIAQSVGVALTGLCKFDDLVCEYFIGPDQKPCGQQTRGRLS